MLVRFEREATKRSEKLTQLYNDQLQKLTGQLNLNKGDVQELAQGFGLKLPGKFDLGKAIDPKRPFELKGLSKVLPKLEPKLPKFDEQAEDSPPLKLPTFSGSENKNAPKDNDVIRQASEVEHTLEDLGSLFGKKKKTAPKTVQPAAH